MQLYTTLNTGQTMPLLGLGVYDMYNQEAEQAVEWAIETGYRLIDTASMYENEIEIGNAIRRSNIQRSELFVTTKVHNNDQGYDNTLKAFKQKRRGKEAQSVKKIYQIHDSRIVSLPKITLCLLHR
ncbi:MAG: aldo/keto reductase [Flectobacillus sp.]|uniref:aldo/keto reductase n=1 Tax=Flectobacillus sp. TaxID=50419 RepID=UPI003B9C3F76